MLILMLALDEVILAVIARRVSPAVDVVRQFDSGMAVLLVALGIPVGFLMNQIYYLIWDGMAESLAFIPPPLDRGREVLAHLDEAVIGLIHDKGQLSVDLTLRTERVQKRLLFVGPPWPLLKLKEVGASYRREYRDVRRKNWRAVRWLMLYAVDNEDSDLLRSEYGGRADNYHALGGSFYAVLTALPLCIIYNAIVHFGSAWAHPGATAITLFLWVALTFGAAVVLLRARANTLQVMQETLIDGLRSTVKLPFHRRFRRDGG